MRGRGGAFMNLPRLIIADEIGEKSVPASLLLVQALRSRGARVNVFMSGRREEYLRLMELLSGAPVCCIDTYSAGSGRNLKTLFQRRAAPDAINVVSVPLGKAVDERTFQTYPEPQELAKVLDCGILPILNASTSAVATTNRTLSVFASLNEAVRDRVQGLLLASVKNPRDFQLLEQEHNRRSPVLSLGYIPKNVERAMPALIELAPHGASMKLLQLKSASLQLGSAVRQVEWSVIEALARLNEPWTPPELLRYPSCHLNVAVIGQDISLEGEGNIEALRAMGCTPHPCDPTRDPFPMAADMLYFPHALADTTAERILTNAGFREGILKSVQNNKLILATGASAVLFGQQYRTTAQNVLEGLGVFPFHAYSIPRDEEHGARKIEIRGTRDTYFTRTDERLRGYEIKGVAIANPGNLGQPCLSYRNMNGDAETGVSGWNSSYCFVTGLRLDLWSSLDILHRWLSLRKRK